MAAAVASQADAEAPLLEAVRLTNFKSYGVVPTLLKVRSQNGLTAIVGKNGCGKSAIVDAILWVFGHRATSIRATNARALVNRNCAEPVHMKVELIFIDRQSEQRFSVHKEYSSGGSTIFWQSNSDNPDSTARIGQSEMHKRLKALGIESTKCSGFIVSQATHGQAFQGTGSSLLTHFEKITGTWDEYGCDVKNMQDAIHNLSDEFMSKASLKRAKVSELDKMEKILQPLPALHSKCSALLGTAMGARDDAENFVASLRDAAAELAHEIKELEDQHSDTKTLHAACQELVRKSKQQLQKCTKTIHGCTQRNLDLADDVGKCRARIKKNKAAIKRNVRFHEVLGPKKLLAAEQAIKEAVAEVSNAKSAHSVAAKQETALRGNVSVKVGAGSGKRQKLKEELTLVRHKISSASADCESIQKASRILQQHTATVNELDVKQHFVQTELAAAVAKRTELKTVDSNLHRKCGASGDSKKQAMTLFQAFNSPSNTQANSLFAKALAHVVDGKAVLGSLGRLVRCTNQYGLAPLNIVLHGRLRHTVVVSSRNAALRVSDYFVKQKIGKVSCIVLDEYAKSDESRHFKMLTPLSTYVECSQSCRTAIDSILRSWYCCRDQATALRFLKTSPKFRGHIVTPCGFVCLDGGREFTRFSTSAVLRLAKQLANPHCRIKLTPSAAATSGNGAHATSTEPSEQILEKQSIQLRRQLQRHEKQATEGTKDVDRLMSHCTELKNAFWQAMITCGGGESSSALPHLSTLESQLAEQIQLRETLRLKAKKLQDEIEAVQSVESAKVTDMASVRSRLRACEREVQKAQARHSAAVHTRDSLITRIQTASTKAQRLKGTGQHLQEELEKLLETKETFEKKSEDAAAAQKKAHDECQKASTGLRQLEKRLDEAESKLQLVRKQAFRLADVQERLGGKVSTIGNTVSSLQRQLESWSMSCEIMAESRPREFLVKKRKGRTSKLSNINHDDNPAENSDTSDAPNTGDVSSVVQAASSRFKALSSRLQRVQTEYVRYSADSAVVPVQATTAFESLYANAALLHTAASEAGRRLQDLREKLRSLQLKRFTKFRSNVDTVNRHLQNAYRCLCPFGGSRLTLGVDGPTVFDGEITTPLAMRCKPGKHSSWQGFESLSGGQKALCSLALTLAMQQLRPAPFYLLDEIDSALDTVKIEAVAKLLTGASASAEWMVNGRRSQYIVLTHKAEMYENAGLIVGIFQPHAMKTTSGIEVAYMEQQNSNAK